MPAPRATIDDILRMEKLEAKAREAEARRMGNAEYRKQVMLRESEMEKRAKEVEASHLEAEARCNESVRQGNLPDLEDAVMARGETRSTIHDFIYSQCTRNLAELAERGVTYVPSTIYISGVSNRAQGSPAKISWNKEGEVSRKTTSAVKNMAVFITEYDNRKFYLLNDEVLRDLLRDLWGTALETEVWKGVLRPFKTKEELRKETDRLKDAETAEKAVVRDSKPTDWSCDALRKSKPKKKGKRK